jgi:cytochrome c-type biogenesis protein CcmH/NrfF
MVFHYTNFVAETNAWWCRRVRPLWLVPSLFLIAGAGYRYIFFGKIQAYRNKYLTTDEERIEHAKLNKRSYGFNSFYNGNNLERSRKKLIL